MPPPPPGRDLDALIARRLWRAIVVHEADGEPYLVSIPERRKVTLPRYSTSDVDCQRVINHMRTNGWTLRITDDDGGVRACFFQLTGTSHEAIGNTASHTICLAALRALDND